MFDIGWTELAVIGVVALIVIGPKDLPRVLYNAGKMAGKARAMLRELQQGIEDIGREAELDEMRKKIESARDFDVNRQIRNAVDPRGEIEAAFDTGTHRPPPPGPGPAVEPVVEPAVEPRPAASTDAAAPLPSPLPSPVRSDDPVPPVRG